MSIRVSLGTTGALLATTAFLVRKLQQAARTRPGGKATPLIRLVDAISKHPDMRRSIRVPRFVVVFSQRWTEDDMEQMVRSHLPGVNLFAVRSSTLCEDSDQKAFAGHFRTELGVRFHDLAAAVRLVEASFVLPVNRSADQEPDVDVELLDDYVRMASGQLGRRYAGGIIIQEFLQTRKAGVMYTNVGRGLCVIAANFGLCTTVVDGSACDQYVLQALSPIASQEPFRLVQRVVKPGKQAARFTQAGSGRSGGVVKMDEKRKFDEAVLDERELAQLFDLGQRLERFAGGKPLDVEWGFTDDGDLYVLQYRPITGGANRIFPNATLFDSTNVGESYTGIVLPMTLSVAQEAYQRAFREALDLFGVPSHKLKRHDAVFANLLANVQGRVFYNMNNWHRLAAFLPKFVKHRRNFDDMVTSHSATDSVPVQEEEEIRPTLWETVRFCTHFPYRLSQLDEKVTKWTADLKRAVHNAAYIDDAKSLCQVALLANDLSEAYFRGTFTFRYLCLFVFCLTCPLPPGAFLVPVNDWCVATLFGILGKKNLRQHIDFSRESISARQVNSMWHLAQFLRGQPEVWRQVELGTDEAAVEFKRLLSLCPDVAKQVYSYTHMFGGRFANELKLETPDLANDFAPFTQALRLYASLPQPVAGARVKTSTVDRLSWLNRWWLRQFEFYAQRREELRLLRSNTFGALRCALVHMGRRLHQDFKALDAPDDIFYLRKEHLEPVLTLARQQQARSDQDAQWRELCEPLLMRLRVFVKAAKESYTAYQSVPPPPADFVSLDGHPVPPHDEKQEMSADDDGGGVLRGTGCCDGKVTGRVRVFEEYAMPSHIDFDVLAARRTDPGWILLIGLTKAMVVEEGNLLSHAASVAREYRIPTVIGVRNACARLRTGQVVEVDGGRGTVTSLGAC